MRRRRSRGAAAPAPGAGASVPATGSSASPAATVPGGYGEAAPRPQHTGASTVEYTVLVVLVAIVVIVTTAVMWNHTRPAPCVVPGDQVVVAPDVVAC